MSDAVDRAFYELTVKQRDAAWLEIERLKAELAVAKSKQEADVDVDFSKALSLEDRIIHAQAQVSELLNMLDFASVVVLTPFSHPEMTIAFRSPACSPKCPDPEKCDQEILVEGSRFLAQTATEIRTGKATMQVLKKQRPQ